MDKATYTKTTLYKLFRFNIFSKTETYAELSGEAESQQIEIIVKPEYYNREFDINKDDKK